MTTGGGRSRRLLAPLGHAYSAVMRMRNLAFDRGWLRSHRLPVRVLAVGNLTVGGTGKTPMVAWLVACARSRGLRVGVVARGYGRPRGARLNDEGELLARRFAGLPQEQDPDRVTAIGRLLDRGPLDLVVLDDGFQHRRVQRDFDLVCVDASRPLEGERVLPAGDLREGIRGLQRAHAVVLTRAEGVAGDGIDRQVAFLRAAAGKPIPVFVAEHAPSTIVKALDGSAVDLEQLREHGIELLSSIARPSSFAATVRSLGLEVIRHHVFPDHHRHDPATVNRIVEAAAAGGHAVLTTEKDVVKLDPPPASLLVLRIDLRFREPEPTPAEVGIR